MIAAIPYTLNDAPVEIRLVVYESGLPARIGGHPDSDASDDGRDIEFDVVGADGLPVEYDDLERWDMCEAVDRWMERMGA
jgi:hypothetical protein